FHTGEDSSRRESELYEKAAERLARWRYPVLAVDTVGASTAEVAAYLTDRIAVLVEGPAAEVASA
ncbi:MAG: hypothetical protein ACRDZY_09500, partial [Acidimicrobiales bacterium]